MGFIYNQKIPFGGEHFIVLFKFSTDQLGTTHVLHGGKIDILASFFRQPFKGIEIFSFCAGTIMIVGTVVKYLTEILKPALINYGTVSKDNGAAHI